MYFLSLHVDLSQFSLVPTSRKCLNASRDKEAEAKMRNSTLPWGLTRILSRRRNEERKREERERKKERRRKKRERETDAIVFEVNTSQGATQRPRE